MGIKMTQINITKITGSNVGYEYKKLNGAMITQSLRRAHKPTPMPRRLPREDNVTSYYDHEEAFRYGSLIEKSLGLDRKR